MSADTQPSTLLEPSVSSAFPLEVVQEQQAQSQPWVQVSWLLVWLGCVWGLGKEFKRTSYLNSLQSWLSSYASKGLFCLLLVLQAACVAHSGSVFCV